MTAPYSTYLGSGDAQGMHRRDAPPYERTYSVSGDELFAPQNWGDALAALPAVPGHSLSHPRLKPEGWSAADSACPDAEKETSSESVRAPGPHAQYTPHTVHLPTTFQRGTADPVHRV